MAAAKELIYSSPDKCANLALACLALLAAFITILVLVSHSIGITVASIGIVFLIPFLVFYFRRWSAHLPAVTITPEGIIDQAWAMGACIIYWDEVIDCSVVRYALSDWLVFRVVNPRSILVRMPLHRRIGAFIAGLFLPSSVMIPGNTIEISAQELLERVKSYYTTYVETPQQGSN